MEYAGPLRVKKIVKRLDRSVAVMADIAVFPENFGKYPNCIC